MKYSGNSTNSTLTNRLGGIEFQRYLFYIVPFLCITIFLGLLYIFFCYEYKSESSAENHIDIQCAYFGNGGTLFINAYNEGRFDWVPFKFESDEQMKPLTYSFSVPYVSSHDFTMSFDAGKNRIVLHGIYINDTPLDLKNYQSSLSLSNFDHIEYSEKYDSLILDVSGPQNEIRFNRQLLQNIPKFNDQQNLEFQKSEADAQFNQKLMMVLVFLTLGVLLSIIFIRPRVYKYLNWLILLSSFVALNLSFVFVIENYIAYLNGADIWGNFNKFQCNYLPIMFFTLVLPLLIISAIRKTWVRILLSIVPILSFLILLGDNFVISVLDSRFIFSGSGMFLKRVDYAGPFIIKYLKSNEGMMMIDALLLFIFAFILSIRSLYRFNAVSLGISGLLLLTYGFYPIGEKYNDYKFSNVFQVNNLTLTNRGNYQASYSEGYSYLKNLDYRWQIRKGLDLRKNIIILLVESLDCSLTFACGNTEDLTPNITRLARDNLFFDRYYSNNFNTHGAYLTVVKTIPYFPPKDMIFSDRLLSLYNENDLLEAFRKYGYVSSFFSSTDLVYGMAETVALSNYDHIYDNHDQFYDGVTKRYIFNSVPDEDLYELIAYRATQETSPFLYITKSASSHTPFSSPFGNNNFKKSFQYTDVQVKRFVELLQKNGFFEHGILVITGDHKAWGNQHGELLDLSANGQSNANLMEANHVPLIIVDGKQRGAVNHTYFSHSSLGVYLQSLALPEYKINRFQADVIANSSPETIVHYEHDKRNFALIRIGDKEAEVILNGDRTEFVEHVFDDETEKLLLGYIASCRQ